MSEENKAVVRKYYELLDKGDVEKIKSLLDDSLSWQFPVQPDPLTKETTIPMVQAFTGAFSDMKHSLGVQIAEGEWVVTPLTFRGTHTGDLMGIPASGNAVTFRGINIHRIVDGKMVEGETSFDMLSFMQQVGAIPKQG